MESFIAQLARAAKRPDPQGLASAWMMLMEGAIMSARVGQKNAALKAKQAAAILLDGWGKAKPVPKRNAKPKSRR